jgi:hypothetical protein
MRRKYKYILIPALLLSIYLIQLCIGLYFSYVPIDSRTIESYGITIKAYRGYGLKYSWHPIVGLIHYVSPHGRVIAERDGIVIGKTDYDVYDSDADLDEIEIVETDTKYEIVFPGCRSINIRKRNK